MNENEQKVLATIEKIQLIYKRVVIGVIITILMVLILIDTAIIKQTIKAKNYIETTATYVDIKNNSEDSIFDEHIYTFVDKNEKRQEIIISISKDEQPEQEIKIKYDENNPQEFFEEGQTYDKSGIIWYVVKIVLVILLIILFCNKKLLSKINISSSRN